MPYNKEEKPFKDLKKLVDEGWVCAEPQCKGGLTVAWGGSFGYEFYILRCNKNIDHQAIMRHNDPSPADIPGFNLFDAQKKRRKVMNQELGEAKTKALAKYEGVVSLTKAQAKEILVAVFPNAPEPEITRACILCASYGLNPLMKHVFLIPFKKKGTEEKTWATVIGIKAKRLLASRRGSYSYVDNTPRVMTDEEQRRIFGETYSDKIMVITKVKDPATGAEVPGYGAWPTNSEPYGTDKGNSQFNMAAIRSESQALDRLRPGEMPVGIEVVPEEVAEEAVDTAIDVEFKVKEEPEEKPKEHWCKEHNCPYERKVRGTSVWWAHKLPGGGWCNEIKKKEVQPELAATSQEAPLPSDFDFDPHWLTDSLKQVHWEDATVKSYLKNVYQADTEGTVVEVVARLTREQREAFIKEIQSRLEMI